MTQTKKKGTSTARVTRKIPLKVDHRCEKVAVLFAVNNGYAPYLGVALASSVEHAGAIGVVERRPTNPILRAHPLYEHSRHLARRKEQEVYQAWEDFSGTTLTRLTPSVYEKLLVQSDK